MPGLYDLTVDTGHMTPADCVAAIAALLDAPPQQRAFAQLAAL